MEFEIIRYSPEKATEWDDFVRDSWNGVFLFYRNFMDYHSDRFNDYSLMVYQDGKLKAVLPANEKEGVLYSHQGLTYGGWVLAKRLPVVDLGQMFDILEEYLRSNGFSSIDYRQKPWVFARHACEYDGWLMWNKGYEIWRRDLSFFFDMKNHAGYARDKRYRFNKSQRNNLRVEEKGDVSTFMALVDNNLMEKYNTLAVHRDHEVKLLQDRFPQNLMILTVHQGDVFLGGTWLFVDNDFVHTQYFHFNDEGRRLCAPEFLASYIIDRFSGERRYFSFGASTEENGKVLNEGLASFKEGFGAGGFCNDFYRKQICR